MNWFDMSRDNLKAARLAKKHGHCRTASSRAYYAVYAALARVFQRDHEIQFRYEGNNPGHRQLLALTANNLDAKRYSMHDKHEMKKSLRVLQTLRINADYNPRLNNSAEREEATIALRNASSVMKRLGVLV
ncbi:MAG: HEPN domain-containing protein [Planctomycetota bacterium]